MTPHPSHAVGPRFDPHLMQQARERSWAALEGIRALMRPGISEDEARAQAMGVFARLGYQRLWHPVLIRIGANTTKTFRQPSDPSVRLGENDIYFVDLGLVFDGHEGDVGDTFTTGDDPGMAACAAAARTLFDEVADMWRERGVSGRALYRYAEDRARALGWRLNHATKGHRVSDFPHAIHRAGDLAALTATPASGLWILEIQITHPTEPYGAFYEDLLTQPKRPELEKMA
jgi:Xaa-Pro aminopeptidase